MESERLILRPMREPIDWPLYVQWLEDETVTRFLEVGIWPQVKEDVEAYLKRVKDDLFLGIHIKDSAKWIGTIRLGDISWVHRRGEIGIMIGDREEWGKGYAVEAIQTVCSHAGSRMGLHKVTAGVIGLNISAQRVFHKAGFFQEAVLTGHRWCSGQWCSEFRFGRILCE